MSTTGSLGLSSKEAYRALGGKSAVRAFVGRTNKRFCQWANVTIDSCICEEDPDEMDFLNVQVEMKYASNAMLPDSFMEAKEEAVVNCVWKFLDRHGLDFDYECGGDGEFGPIASYRVRRAQGAKTKRGNVRKGKHADKRKH